MSIRIDALRLRRFILAGTMLSIILSILFMGSGGGAGTGAVDIRQGLVGYWAFDENSTSTYLDTSGYGNNGVHSLLTPNRLQWRNCEFGSCLNFNRTLNTYIQTPTTFLPSGNATRSVSLWIYPTISAEGDSAIFSYGCTTGDGSCFNILVRNDGSLYFQGNNLDSATGLTVTMNIWNFIVFTYTFTNQVNLVAYLAVASVAHQDLSLSRQLSTSAGSVLYIGTRADGPTISFTGREDDVRLYNSYLSGIQVQQLFNYGKLYHN